MNRPCADHHDHKECEQKCYIEREKHLSRMSKSFSYEETPNIYWVVEETDEIRCRAVLHIWCGVFWFWVV